MAFITADIKLPEVGRTVTVRLYYPTDLPRDVGCEVKGVITLLHGMSNNGNDWMMMSAAARYAADNGYVLVAPDAGNSFYHDMAYGPPFYTIMTQLLPAQLRCIFNLPDEREKNFIAGLSMGGYGALRIGLSCPERYAAVGSFSGGLDARAMADACMGDLSLRPVLAPVFGPELVVDEEADLFSLARKVARLPAAQQPRIYCSVGRQDHGTARIYEQNQNFRKAVHGLPLDFTYEEWDGVHEWNFWDRSLARFIGFIQGSGYAARKEGDWCAPVEKG